MISGGFAAKVILKIVLKFGDNQLKGRDARGVKLISRGFAASDITNIVLKFGDNWAKGRGVTGEINLWKTDEKV